LGESFATNLDADTPAISAPQSSTSEHSRDWADAASRGVIVVAAVVLAWYTWASWGDIQIDVGRELYVPVEILRGKLIYRDIFYSYGPLAPYLCALLLGIFGMHLVVLYLFGIAVAITCALLLFELGKMLEGRAAGLTAALALLFVGVVSGIFNYVLPYSYAATIGLAFGLLCSLFTIRHLLDRGRYNLFLAGLGASLAILCKQEFGVACYLMLAFVLVAEAILRRSARTLFRGIGACLPGVVPWLAIYGWFFWTLTPAYMLDANWVGMPGTPGQANADHLYALNGQRFIPHELVTLAACAVACLALWTFLAKASRGLRNVVLAIVVAIAASNRFGLLTMATREVTAFLVFPFGMFFIGLGFVAYATYAISRRGDLRHFGEVAFGIFALVPAVRVIARMAPFGYCIFYAMPLFLVFVIAVSRCIKAATPALSIDRRREVVNYLLAAEVVLLALICIPQTKERSALLETSWGTLRVEPEKANSAQQILAFISEQKRSGRRVTILPEAAMLYALTGTEAPSRWYTLLPGYLTPAGENAYIAELNRAAPAYILLTARNSSEYGAAYFGIDYDQKIYQWIQSNYSIAGQLGSFRRVDRYESSKILAALVYQRRGPLEAPRSGAIISHGPN
jgi:Dolichyl-phosphate-mannose-protein mannosyltransferase